MDKITIIRFQLLVHQLLKVHYGITLSDTGLSDDAEVSRMIELGISAVNRLVDKYHLEKLNASCYLPASPYVSDTDALHAQAQLSGAINPDVMPG